MPHIITFHATFLLNIAVAVFIGASSAVLPHQNSCSSAESLKGSCTASRRRENSKLGMLQGDLTLFKTRDLINYPVRALYMRAQFSYLKPQEPLLHQHAVPSIVSK
jgi:hypothetical protein